MRRLYLSFFLLGSCSILVRQAPLCADGTIDPGEICFTETQASVGVAPFFVELVDLDRDGDLDIVNTNAFKLNAAESTVTTLINDGAGNFGPAVEVVVPNNPGQVVSADFNGDGILDLAVACPGLVNDQGFFSDQSLVSILLGDGAGGFSVVQNLTIGDPLLPLLVGSQTLAAGDLNGDGFADLAIANSTSGKLAVIINNAGTLNTAAPLLLDTGSFPLGVALGDLDQDQDLDIVTNDNALDLVQGIAGQTLKIFQNNGDATFAAPVPFGIGLFPQLISLGDLDKDGDLDIVVTNNLSNNVSILTNNSISAGQLNFNVSFIGVGQGPGGVLAADLNGDQAPEILVPEPLDDDLLVLNNDGVGSFTPLVPIKLGDIPLLLASGDLNGDGLFDVVVSNNNSATLSILLSTP